MSLFCLRAQIASAKTFTKFRAITMKKDNNVKKMDKDLVYIKKDYIFFF